MNCINHTTINKNEKSFENKIEGLKKFSPSLEIQTSNDQ